MNINDKITIDTYACGDNNRVVTIGELKLYFSYKTVIAFECTEHGMIASENIWGRTSGSHLNIIAPNEDRRIDRNEFERFLEMYLHDLNLLW